MSLFTIGDKTGEQPCGECHLQPGETCDICHASQPDEPAQAWQVRRHDGDGTWGPVNSDQSRDYFARHPDTYELRGLYPREPQS